MCSFYKSREMKTERMSWGKNVERENKKLWGRREGRRRRRRRMRAILSSAHTSG